MNRIDPSRKMRRLSPRATVISGAAIGLIAGAAVFGAISSSASSPTPPVFKQASATRDIKPAPAKAAPCDKDQKLEHGVCIVHVVRTVVVPAAGAVSQNSDPAGSASAVSESASHDSTSPAEPAERTEPAEHAEGAEPGDDAAEHPEDAAEHAKDAAEHAKDAAEHVSADS